jgi:hypothetical protein
MLLANPLDKAVGKEAQLCQRHGPKVLAKPTRASGGKPIFANSFGPGCWQSWEFFSLFLLLFSSL